MNTPTQLLSIRFVGESLNTRGVPIYDLAQSLISIQRIIHKSYLATEGRLSDSPMATKAEREKLALRIGERKRNSDEYGLIAFLSDP
ncbi:MAG: hypothetical protein IPP19_08935 [Verrucomicrobia bacterium]|nr:hypothetical protein [Verrucomicrobiota bacterium]